MKKILTFIMLFVSLFTVLAVANTKDVEALSVTSGSKIYFEKPSNWSASYVQFMIGHGSWSEGYSMTLVPGTSNIYYVEMIQWDGATKFAFVNTNESKWGGEGGSIDNRLNWVINKTATSTANVSGTRFYYVNGSSLSYSTTLNYKITANAEVGGTATVSGVKLSTNTTSSVNGTSGDIAYRTNATLTATANAGYKFVGWYDGSSLKSSSETYTVQVTAAKTYTAKFECSHQSNGGWVNNENNHWKVCSTCGVELNKSAHTHTDTRVEPTLEADGSVTYTCECGHTYTEILPNTELVNTSLKNLVKTHYNSGVYTRTTHLYVNKELLKEEFAIHFHNPQGGENVILDRQTEFVDDYLYFVETGTGFGTNSKGNLTSFNWNKLSDEQKGNLHSDSNINAIEEAFYTLFDLMNTDATWTYDGKAYVTNNETVIKIAEGFTAPGWESPSEEYTDYTQVLVYEENGQLVIELYVSSTNYGFLTTTPASEEAKHVLFSQAIIG